ncbi:MAG TPA: hypothetical protein VM492_09125 [Sumerlaeia bacterium]|nr:hypothetical protein [Sumerlaeia bacterium]
MKWMMISNKPVIVHKLVFELRYSYGFSYLDKCGWVVNSIMRDRPEWILANTSPNPQNAPLINTNNNCRFNFSSLKLDLTVEQGLGEASLTEDDVSDFLTQVEEITPVVVDGLDLREFTRIGFRVWYMFACGSSDEAETWLRDLGCCQVSQRVAGSFRGRVKATGFSVVIESEDRSFRIAFNGVERSLPVNLGGEVLNIPPHTLHENQREHLLKQIRTKKRIEHNPQFAAMIDIDAYQEMPEKVEPGYFVRTSYEKGMQYLRECIDRGT